MVTTAWLVIYKGQTFHGLGSQDDFVGLYFRGIPTLITSYIAKIHFMDTETFVAANFGELTTKHINFGDKLWQI